MRSIPIENLKPIDETAIQVLRVIALNIGDAESAFVDYKKIATSLNVDRRVVASAVQRMERRKILIKTKDGKLSIPCSIYIPEGM